ncbi:Fur family transcriptional regulator [Flagellimonas sp. 2504JD1-5]
MEVQLDNVLKNRGIRPTAMRMLVLRFLANSKTAKTLNAIENSFDMADRTTVYRTIKLFEKKGVVHQIDNGTGVANYALCEENCNCVPGKDLHLHFHCTKCGETLCLTNHKIPTINLPNGYMPENMNLLVKGRCPSCFHKIDKNCSSSL